VSSVSNDPYFLSLPLVSVTCVIYTYKNGEKVWGARFTLGAHYLLKNTVFFIVMDLFTAAAQYGYKSLTSKTDGILRFVP
jgi:hypothetical protein